MRETRPVFSFKRIYMRSEKLHTTRRASETWLFSKDPFINGVPLVEELHMPPFRV